jgi:hypothetical protein
MFGRVNEWMRAVSIPPDGGCTSEAVVTAVIMALVIGAFLFGAGSSTG